jgi:short-subunit dehydrogenase
VSDEQRLERIEKKLDEMGQAIISIARMEEKMLTVFKRIEDHATRITRVEDDVSEIENKIGINGQTLRFAERVFWIVAAAGVTYILKVN